MELFFATLGFLVAATVMWARPTSHRTRWYDRHLAEHSQVEFRARLVSGDGDVVEWRLGSTGRADYFQSNPMLVATRPNSLESLEPGPMALSRLNSTCAEAPPRLLASTSLVNTYSPGLR
jgi:hypothetical protein